VCNGVVDCSSDGSDEADCGESISRLIITYYLELCEIGNRLDSQVARVAYLRFHFPSHTQVLKCACFFLSRFLRPVEVQFRRDAVSVGQVHPADLEVRRQGALRGPR
jgi:hypothetical protein